MYVFQSWLESHTSLQQFLLRAYKGNCQKGPSYTMATQRTLNGVCMEGGKEAKGSHLATATQALQVSNEMRAGLWL
jgi:hypothetical protein